MGGPTRVLGATVVTRMQELLTTNSTDTSFTARPPVATRPSGTGVIDLGVNVSNLPDTLVLQFFGAGSDDQTFDYRVTGYMANPAGTYFTPRLIAQGSATLSTFTGIASGDVTASERYADTLDVDYGIGVVFNPLANAGPSTLELDPAGCTVFQVDFDMTGATSANCLWGVR